MAWGTAGENREDQYRLGEAEHGERHPLAKLKDADVIAIYNDSASTCKALAARHGVCPMVISDIRRGRIKRRITGATGPGPGAFGCSQHPKTKITAADAVEVFTSSRRLAEEAERLGVSQQTIYAIRHRRKWRRATAHLPDRLSLPSMPSGVDMPAHPFPSDAPIAAAAPLQTAQ